MAAKFYRTLEIIVLTLTGCILNSHAEHPTMSEPASITVTDKDQDGHVQLTLGEILTLRLGYIPGTGYSWHIARNNGELMGPLGEVQYERSESKLLGATEYQIFRFRALASGTNILELHYSRPWEKVVVPLKAYRITVQIR